MNDRRHSESDAFNGNYEEVQMAAFTATGVLSYTDFLHGARLIEDYIFGGE